VDEANPTLGKRLLSEIEIVKHELRELRTMFKMLEKGPSILVMLDIGGIVLLALVLILQYVRRWLLCKVGCYEVLMFYLDLVCGKVQLWLV